MALHSEHQGYSAGRLQLQGREQDFDHLLQNVHQNGERGSGEERRRVVQCVHVSVLLAGGVLPRADSFEQL